MPLRGLFGPRVSRRLIAEVRERLDALRRLGAKELAERYERLAGSLTSNREAESLISLLDTVIELVEQGDVIASAAALRHYVAGAASPRRLSSERVLARCFRDLDSTMRASITVGGEIIEERPLEDVLSLVLRKRLGVLRKALESVRDRLQEELYSLGSAVDSLRKDFPRTAAQLKVVLRRAEEEARRAEGLLGEVRRDFVALLQAEVEVRDAVDRLRRYLREVRWLYHAVREYFRRADVERYELRILPLAYKLLGEAEARPRGSLLSWPDAVREEGIAVGFSDRKLLDAVVESFVEEAINDRLGEYRQLTKPRRPRRGPPSSPPF